MFYIVAIQIVIEKIVKSPTDTDEIINVLLLVQVFNNLNHDLIEKTEECCCQEAFCTANFTL